MRCSMGIEIVCAAFAEAAERVFMSVRDDLRQRTANYRRCTSQNLLDSESSIIYVTSKRNCLDDTRLV